MNHQEVASARELPAGHLFADDDGSADPMVLAILREHAVGDITLAQVVEALSASRVLLPLLPGAAGAGCHDEGEQRASSGVVAVQARDGRWALPVFTHLEALSAWKSEARPIPALLGKAALSAVSEQWSLLVVNPAGPDPTVIPRPAVWSLAQGEPWQPAIVEGQVEPIVHRAVVDAIEGIDHVAQVWAEPGRTAEVAVVLRLDPGLDRSGLDRVIADINRALASSAVMAQRVDGVELRIGRA